MSNLHLGLDSSTQSLTGVVLDLDTRRLVYAKSLNFDETLPHYGTREGVFRTEDPTVIHAPPLMWLEALDAIFAEMKGAGVALGQIQSISGSGQQHGSVYLNDTAVNALTRLDPKRTLVGNLGGMFSRATSPIWMDSSTSQQCAEIAHALEGRGGIVPATGSAATERFTGPQIRKFYQQAPDAYARTRHIALVSSFMCSVLAGKIAPIDPGDGAGMNLMDIRTLDWHPGALASTAPGLAAKLPPLAASGTVVGSVSSYWSRKFGVNPSAQIVIWSGDNPCSVVGLGLVKPGLVGISMGTSYTYFGTMAECHVDPRGEGHVFGSPAGGYMTLNCFKNGGLARARMRDRYGLDWEGYARAMASVPPGNKGRLLLPWFDTEIVPRVLKPGVHRLDLAEDDAAGNCRALVEAQMMMMRLHADWMELDASLIIATGGASEDPAVLQVMADVFQCPVKRSEITKSAAIGAALIAAHAVSRQPDWMETIRGFADLSDNGAVSPSPTAAAVYPPLLQRYAAFERAALQR
jgi:xylulokinase